MVNLVCPICGSELIREDSKVVCSVCGSFFPIISGIITFFREEDSFYENKFVTTEFSKSITKNFVKKCMAIVLRKISLFGMRNKHQKHFTLLKADHHDQINVLDLGCGHGNPFLLQTGFHIVGVDISLSSLIDARKIYNEVYKAQVSNLPFPSDNFDCVCSFDLLGHIPLSEKPCFFNELHRVLKSGGLSFHYIEVNSLRDYDYWAKQYPALYKKYFIAKDGHFGLECYKAVLARFEKHGFLIVDYALLGKLIFKTPGELSKRFDNEFKQKNFTIRVLASIDSFFSKNKILCYFYSIILKLFEGISGNLLSDDFGGLLFVVVKKK